MTANTYWCQVKPVKCKDLKVNSPSWFYRVMKNANMELPITLGKENIERLHGMASMVAGDNDNPFDQIIELIEKYGNINVWQEH